jgi:hypothetical protein
MLHKIKWLQCQLTSRWNSLVNRLLSTLLKHIEYTKTYKHILNTAEVNVFDKQLIDMRIKTLRRLKHIKETTHYIL